MRPFSQEYRDYLDSPAWAAKRRDILIRAGHRCEYVTPRGTRCKRTRRLHVHHRTYEHLGNEPREDLVALCKPHHHQADATRKVTKAIDTHFRRIDGWARKVYGEDWELEHDPAEVADEFNDWLERKREVEYA